MNYNQDVPDGCDANCKYPEVRTSGDDALCYNQTVTEVDAEIPVDNWICNAGSGEEHRCQENGEIWGVWDVTGLSWETYLWADMQEYCNNCPDGSTTCCDDESLYYPLLLSEAGCNKDYPETFNLTGLKFQAVESGQEFDGPFGLVYDEDMMNGLDDDLTLAEHSAILNGIRIRIETDIPLNHPVFPVTVYLKIVNLDVDEGTEVYCHGTPDIFICNPDTALESEIELNQQHINIDLPYNDVWFDFIHDNNYTFNYSAQLRVIGNGNEEIDWSGNIQFSLTYDENWCPPLGDINNDGIVNILDIVQIVDCVLAQNCTDHYLVPYPCAADVNGDDAYNILDIVELANCIVAETCGDL